jgi:predicted DNA-binding transcriptional regulator AlpA
MNRTQKQPVERLTYRIYEVAAAIGVSRRTIERERSAGHFPQPNLHIGKAPLWTREAIDRWIKQGGWKN